MRYPLNVALNDTHPAIHQMMVEAYRKMTPQQKLERVQQMNEAVLQLAAARITREHPGISKRELQLRLGSLWLDAETMRRAFGWDPDVNGGPRVNVERCSGWSRHGSNESNSRATEG